MDRRKDGESLRAREIKAKREEMRVTDRKERLLRGHSPVFSPFYFGIFCNIFGMSGKMGSHVWRWSCRLWAPDLSQVC